MEIIAKDEQDTIKAARDFAASLRAPALVRLRGDLGAGKTAFARALIRALSGDEALTVPSPTFTLLQTYESAAGPIWHFDLYRLEDAADIFELGWEDAVAEGITIVEWPDRLGSYDPAGGINITITGAGDAQRQIIIE